MTKKTKTAIPAEPDLPEFIERKCHNLYSEHDLTKHLTDYIGDCMLAMGLEEDQLVSNLRLTATAIACAIGGYAARALNFPEDVFLLKIFVMTFLGVIGTLFLFEGLYLKDAILDFKLPEGGSCRLEGWIERKSGKYTLRLSQNRIKQCKASYNLGDLFDSDGHLMTSNVYNALAELLVSFGLYDHQRATASKVGSKKHN